jgi:hypothetical protein
MQTSSKPTGAFVFSIIGGVLGMLASIIIVLIGVSASVLADTSYYSGAYTPVAMLYGGMGVWGFIASGIIVFSAVKLNNYPFEHTKWGVIILVFSIIGLVGIIALIGGIWALAWKPMVTPPAFNNMQPMQPPIQLIGARVCTNCNFVVGENLAFCPNCGKDLNLNY